MSQVSDKPIFDQERLWELVKNAVKEGKTKKEILELLDMLAEKYDLGDYKKKLNKLFINFMNIRISDPSDENWCRFRFINGNYYIVSNDTPKSNKFITLALGSRYEIKGVGFIRGVPRKLYSEVNTLIETKDWVSQAVRVNYEAIDSTPIEDPKIQSEKAMDVYGDTIKKFLEREHPTQIRSVIISPKTGGDFKLELSFYHFPTGIFTKINRELIFNAMNKAAYQIMMSQPWGLEEEKELIKAKIDPDEIMNMWHFTTMEIPPEDLKLNQVDFESLYEDFNKDLDKRYKRYVYRIWVHKKAKIIFIYRRKEL